MPSSNFGQESGLWTTWQRVWTEHWDPGFLQDTILGNVEAGLIVALLIWLLRQVYHRSLPYLARLAGGFSVTLGLRWLALRGYRRALRATFGHVDNIYLDRTESLDLEQVFVPLTLLQRAATDWSSPLRQQGAPLSDNGRIRLLVLGGPGSGKSTLLRALAAGVSGSAWPAMQGRVPVWGPLRQYGLAGQQTPLVDWLATGLRRDFGLRRPSALLRSLGRDGRLLILLDGLDEIGDDAAQWLPGRISELSEALPGGNVVIVTSREASYDQLPDPRVLPRVGFHACRLAELRDAELEAIVARRDPELRKRGKSPDRFLAAISAREPIKQLHRNPLLLTISLGLYLYRAEERVPHNLAEFFEEGIENLLRRRDFGVDPALGTHNRFRIDDKLALLRSFALLRLELTDDSDGDFAVWPVKDLIAQANALADERLHIQAGQGEALVREIDRFGGLIRPAGDNQHFAFVHRAIHEFCAARELAGQGQAGLDKALADPQRRNWTQVLIFYASMDHALARTLVDTLARRADDSGDPRLLVVAGQCAAVLIHPATGLRARVVDLLDAALQQRQDAPVRRALLRTLVDLGRGSGDKVRGQVAELVDRLLGAGHPERIAAEIDRLDHATALRLIQYLIYNRGPDCERAALNALANIDGAQRIPLLWSLIGRFGRRRDRHALLVALELMARILEDPAAVERLNAQPPILTADLSDEEVRRCFPFYADDEPVSNLGRFVALAARVVQDDRRLSDYLISARTDARHYPFNRLLGFALARKEPPLQAQWERLGRLRTGWRPRLDPRLLARVLILGALLFGAWLVANGLAPSGLGQQDLRLLLVLALSLGAFTALAWGPWLGLVGRLGWMGSTFGVYPRWRWLDWSLRPSGLARARGPSLRGWLGNLVRFLVRCLVFSPVVVLLPLALLLTAPRLSGHADDVLAVAFCNHDHHLLTGSRDGSALLWERSSGRVRHRLTGHRAPVTCVACDDDGRYLLTGTADGSATLWDAGSGRVVRRFSGSRKGNPLPLTSVALTRHGDLLVLGDQAGLAKVFDLDSGDKRPIEHRLAGGLRALAFSPDGLQVAAATATGSLLVWDRATNTERQPIADPDHPIRAMALAGTGRDLLLATGSEDGTARLWRLAHRKPLLQFPGHDGAVVAVALARGAPLLATGSLDGTARIWGTGADGKLRHRLEDHQDAVTSIALDHDGRWVLTGSRDDTARLWDAGSGKTLWRSPIPFSHPHTWDGWDLAALALLIVALVLVPSTKWLEPGQRLALGRSNRYLRVYDLPDIEKWIGRRAVDGRVQGR